MKSGTNFSLSGGRHHVVKDLGDGMYGDVKRGVSGVVAMKIVATNAAASAGL